MDVAAGGAWVAGVEDQAAAASCWAWAAAVAAAAAAVMAREVLGVGDGVWHARGRYQVTRTLHGGATGIPSRRLLLPQRRLLFCGGCSGL